MRAEPKPLPSRCPHCTTTLLYRDFDGTPACLCGWRDYGLHAPPLPSGDYQERRLPLHYVPGVS